MVTTLVSDGERVVRVVARMAEASTAQHHLGTTILHGGSHKE